MRLVSLTCNHCGAPLEVPAKTRFLTCTYCSSRLEVHRSGSAVYTEVLEAIDERTQRIADDVATIKMQNELEQLDRQWMIEREQHMVRGKHGTYRVPSATGSLVAAGFAVVFGIFWMGSAASAGAPVPFVLFGLIFIGFAVFGGIHAAQKAAGYEQGRRTYQRRRQEILQDLQQRER